MKALALELPEPSRSLIERTPGWCPHEQLLALHGLAHDVGGLDGDLLEIGTWCGRSAAVLGLAAQRSEATKLYCVDLFPERDDWRANPDGTHSFTVSIDGTVHHGCRHQTVWPEAFSGIVDFYAQHGSPWEVFRSLMTQLDLTDDVVALRGTSETLRTSVGGSFRCKLAYIDAEHSYEAVSEDIRNVEPSLVEGAWLCFDDAFSGYDGVDRALEEMIIGNDRYEEARQVTRKLFVARRTAANQAGAGTTTRSTGGL